MDNLSLLHDTSGRGAPPPALAVAGLARVEGVANNALTLTVSALLPGERVAALLAGLFGWHIHLLWVREGYVWRFTGYKYAATADASFSSASACVSPKT